MDQPTNGDSSNERDVVAFVAIAYRLARSFTWSLSLALIVFGIAQIALLQIAPAIPDVARWPLYLGMFGVGALLGREVDLWRSRRQRRKSTPRLGAAPKSALVARAVAADATESAIDADVPTSTTALQLENAGVASASSAGDEDGTP